MTHSCMCPKLLPFVPNDVRQVLVNFSYVTSLLLGAILVTAPTDFKDLHRIDISP